MSTGSRPKSTAVETVTIEGRRYRAVREGLAQILAPYRDDHVEQKSADRPHHNNDEGDQAVFYNPIQQFNRDLSVLAILVFGEGALEQKNAKQARREKWRQGKKASKQARNAASAPTEQTAIDVTTAKKRKAIELDDATETVPESGKKPKTVEQQNDDHDDGDHDDDDLEIQALTKPDETNPMAREKDSRVPTDEANDENTTANGQSEQRRCEFTILDALSASGLRAVRYAREIPFVTNVVANDLSADAVDSIEINIDHNHLRGRVRSNLGDARAYMYSKTGNEHKKPPAGYVHRFDVIDLDPYGTAAPFLDAAVQALSDGGMLCVTCTDAGVFASNGYPEKAFALYGGVTMKGVFSHEAGLRLILHAVSTSAAKYGIAIEPLLSLSIDFYARLFIRLHKTPQQVKLLAGTIMITYNCDSGCGAWSTQLVGRNQLKEGKNGQPFFKHSYAQGPTVGSVCDHCGSKTHLGGPMWAGPLHNPDFVEKMIRKLADVDKSVYQTTERMKGMLTLALQEDLRPGVAVTVNPTESDTKIIARLATHQIDPAPFFIIPSFTCKVIHCETPPEGPLRGAFRRLGYQVTRSHCKAGSFKTDAPWDVIWEVMREWARQHAPVREGKVVRGMPGWRIMQRMRDNPARSVIDVHDNLKRALWLDRRPGTGADAREDLKAILESALYRLDHPRLPTADNEGSTATTTVGKDVDASPEIVTIDTPTDAAAIPTPATAQSKEPRDVSALTVVFDEKFDKPSRRDKILSYPMKPPNWGPMNRAGGGGGGGSGSSNGNIGREAKLENKEKS